MNNGVLNDSRMWWNTGDFIPNLLNDVECLRGFILLMEAIQMTRIHRLFFGPHQMIIIRLIICFLSKKEPYLL